MLVQSENERIKRIRISERNSHTEIYLNEELYKSDSWLNKPIKTVVDLIPCFKGFVPENISRDSKWCTTKWHSMFRH